MKKQDLKVGMSFDVVRVIKPVFLFSKEFTVGNCYLVLENYKHGGYLRINDSEIALAFSHEIKKIAKLTITKLK